MLKKILIIAIIFFIGAALVTWYVLFFRNSPTTVVPSENTGLPISEEGGDNFNAQFSSAPYEEDANGNYVIPVSALMNLSQQPVAGAYVTQIGTSTLVRYNLRSSGHITEVNVGTGTTTKIANTTIPKIYESVWLSSGQTLIRYLDEKNSIVTYNAKIVTPTATNGLEIGELSGTFMPTQITSLSRSPSNKEIFFLREEGAGSAGYITDSAGTKTTGVFNSPLSEWNTQWPYASSIMLTTKPSYSVNGYLYSLNPSTKGVKKIMGGVLGLTTLVNPSGEFVAYANNTLTLRIHPIQSGADVITTVKTLPEKCVWSQKNKTTLYCAASTQGIRGNFPDDWYQGKVSFADEIYKIDTKTGNSSVLSALAQDYTNPLDIINPELSKNEDYIIFTNKIDGTLWSFHLLK